MKKLFYYRQSILCNITFSDFRVFPEITFEGVKAFDNKWLLSYNMYSGGVVMFEKFRDSFSVFKDCSCTLELYMLNVESSVVQSREADALPPRGVMSHACIWTNLVGAN